MLRNAIADILSSLAERIGTYGFLQHRENCLQREFKRVQTNELMRKREAEYEHQTEENFWMEGPPHWRSRYFLQQGYRIVVGEGPTFLHAIGGPSRHENAICSRCNNPFLLIADIDCSDPVFNSEHCSTFENIKRLPLYFCGHCGDSGYRLLDDGGIKVLRKPYPDDTPFEDVPSMLQPQQFELVPIPREIANLIRLACDVDRDWLNTEESTRLAEYLGNGVEMGNELRLSQVGGSPIFAQGRQETKCINRACPTHRYGHFMMGGFKRHFLMKELAVFDRDIELGLKAYTYVQIAFHICWKCRTIIGDYQCT